MAYGIPASSSASALTQAASSIASGLDALEESIPEGFDSLERNARIHHEQLLSRTSNLEDNHAPEAATLLHKLTGDSASLKLKFDILINKFNHESHAAQERHQALLRYIEWDRRLRLLESHRYNSDHCSASSTTQTNPN